jgi:hypothetical protein
MRFMTIYKPGEESTTPPSAEHMEAMGKFIEELAKSGILIQTDGLVHSSKGARVRMNADGSFKVVDGPFTESKEIIGGYAIINVKSKAEAIEWAKRAPMTASPKFPQAEIEIRPLFDIEDFSPSPAVVAKAREIEKQLPRK